MTQAQEIVCDLTMEHLMTRYVLYNAVAEQLRRHEGFRKYPYRCTAGKLTIGYGRNIENAGITKAEAEVMLQSDIEITIADMLVLFPDFDTLPENIKVVLCNMRFQLGHSGIMEFKKMIAACRARNWKEMARQMRKSSWYEQTTNRAEELAAMLNQ